MYGIIKSAEPDANESTAKFIMDVQNTSKWDLGPKINERNWKMAYFEAIWEAKRQGYIVSEGTDDKSKKINEEKEEMEEDKEEEVGTSNFDNGDDESVLSGGKRVMMRKKDLKITLKR